MWNRCEGIVRNTTGEEVRREATCRLANFTPLAHLSLRHKANKYEHHLTSRTWRLFSGMFNASDLSFMTFQLCSSWNAVLAGTRSGQKRNVQRIQIRTRFGRKKLFNEKRTFFFFWKDKPNLVESEHVRCLHLWKELFAILTWLICSSRVLGDEVKGLRCLTGNMKIRVWTSDLVSERLMDWWIGLRD